MLVRKRPRIFKKTRKIPNVILTLCKSLSAIYLVTGSSKLVEVQWLDIKPITSVLLMWTNTALKKIVKNVDCSQGVIKYNKHMFDLDDCLVDFGQNIENNDRWRHIFANSEHLH